MKKNFFGILALAIAIMSVAFTTASNEGENIFRFDGDNNTQINDPDLWFESTTGVPGCESIEGTPCYVIVDAEELSFQDFHDNYVSSLTEPSDLNSLPGYITKDEREEVIE